MYVEYTIVCILSFLVGGSVASSYYRRTKSKAHPTEYVSDLQLADRVVECIAGLVGTLHISPTEALRTTAIRLHVYSYMSKEVCDFLFTLSTVWSDETVPDRVTIRPEDVKVILKHSSSLRVAQGALLELYEHRSKLPN